VGKINPETVEIDWGPSAKYDRGQLPTLALRGNVVVEVHQSHTGASDLWCHVGKVDATTKTIAWGASAKYDKGNFPSIGF
jgi:hypothetical protein